MKDCRYFDIIGGTYYCEYDDSECMCTSFCENYVRENKGGGLPE